MEARVSRERPHGGKRKELRIPVKSEGSRRLGSGIRRPGEMGELGRKEETEGRRKRPLELQTKGQRGEREEKRII